MATPNEKEDNYFSSYEDVAVHELMLKDQARTLAYKNFIMKNADVFQDKVVVDVGAGTGILSLFAARAGAKHVYAIEASNISQLCKEIVAQNGYSDTITVIHGRVEDVSPPDGVKADILISEWMGFYLLHESMLTSVIRARDKWLTKDGVVFPSNASIYLCPVAMKDYWDENIGCWTDVYGFDFTPLLPSVQAKILSQPVITTINSSQCLADPELVANLDMEFVAEEDLRIIPGHFEFNITKNSVLHGFACWFDVEFEGDEPLNLGTGPDSAETHWKQTVLFLPHPLLVSKGEKLNCSLKLTQDAEESRRYNICIEIADDEDASSDNSQETAEQDTYDDCTDEIKDLIFNAMSSNT